MSSAPQARPEYPAASCYWPWCLTLGISLIAAGAVAITFSCLTAVLTMCTMLVGLLLLSSGTAIVLHLSWAGTWSGFLLHLLVAIFYIIVGTLMLDRSVGMEVLQTACGLLLLFAGIARITFSVSERFPSWPWALFNGGVSVLIGMLISKQFFGTSTWVICSTIGIDLVLNGVSWIMFSLFVRSSSRK